MALIWMHCRCRSSMSRSKNKEESTTVLLEFSRNKYSHFFFSEDFSGLGYCGPWPKFELLTLRNTKFLKQ